MPGVRGYQDVLALPPVLEYLHEMFPVPFPVQGTETRGNDSALYMRICVPPGSGWILIPVECPPGRKILRPVAPGGQAGP